ncbi:MAG: PH domain-containing protein [bacterium]
MHYIENNLAVGETIVYQTRLHWLIFSKSMLIFIGALFFLLGGLFKWISPDAAIGFYLVAGILCIISSVMFIAKWIQYISSEFGVTNSRVLIKVGFISRHSLELLLTKVEGIGVDQSITGRILNYGTIIVSGTGGTKEAFALIAHPLEFRKKVQEQIIALQEINRS